jgi:flagellar motor switch protein FliN/FliY
LATLDNVSIDIAVVLGRTSMPTHQVLRLGRGAIIELDSSEEDEVRILANNMPVAKGTVIVSGNPSKSRNCCRARPSRCKGLRHFSAHHWLCRFRAARNDDHRVMLAVNRYMGVPGLSGGRLTVKSARSRGRFRSASTPHAVVAELVDALA